MILDIKWSVVEIILPSSKATGIKTIITIDDQCILTCYVSSLLDLLLCVMGV